MKEVLLTSAIVVAIFSLWAALIAGIWWLFYFLWNTIAAEVFGLPELTFWQAVGLLVLVGILLGGLRTVRSSK